MRFLLDKTFLRQSTLLILFFSFFYGISRGVIAMSAAEGTMYSSFVASYLDYISGIKSSIVWAVGQGLKWFSIPTTTEADAVIRITGKRGVHITMSCVGFGVYSFWAAFVISSVGKVFKKIKWVLIGLIALWLINIIRIAVFLVVLNHNKEMPFGIDHHTWFNILAYILIFCLMYYYNRSLEMSSAPSSVKK